MAKTTHLLPEINLNRMHTKTRRFPFLYLERVGKGRLIVHLHDIIVA